MKFSNQRLIGMVRDKVEFASNSCEVHHNGDPKERVIISDLGFQVDMNEFSGDLREEVFKLLYTRINGLADVYGWASLLNLEERELVRIVRKSFGTVAVDRDYFWNFYLFAGQTSRVFHNDIDQEGECMEKQIFLTEGTVQFPTELALAQVARAKVIDRFGEPPGNGVLKPPFGIPGSAYWSILEFENGGAEKNHKAFDQSMEGEVYHLHSKGISAHVMSPWVWHKTPRVAPNGRRPWGFTKIEPPKLHFYPGCSLEHVDKVIAAHRLWA